MGKGGGESLECSLFNRNTGVGLPWRVDYAILLSLPLIQALIGF